MTCVFTILATKMLSKTDVKIHANNLNLVLLTIVLLHCDITYSFTFSF